MGRDKPAILDLNQALLVTHVLCRQEGTWNNRVCKDMGKQRAAPHTHTHKVGRLRVSRARAVFYVCVMDCTVCVSIYTITMLYILYSPYLALYLPVWYRPVIMQAVSGPKPCKG